MNNQNREQNQYSCYQDSSHKNSLSVWFGLINCRENLPQEKLYKIFKLTKLYVDKDVYKEELIAVQSVVQKKKREYLEEELKANLKKLLI